MTFMTISLQAYLDTSETLIISFSINVKHLIAFLRNYLTSRNISLPFFPNTLVPVVLYKMKKIIVRLTLLIVADCLAR